MSPLSTMLCFYDVLCPCDSPLFQVSSFPHVPQAGFSIPTFQQRIYQLLDWYPDRFHFTLYTLFFLATLPLLVGYMTLWGYESTLKNTVESQLLVTFPNSYSSVWSTRFLIHNMYHCIHQMYLHASRAHTHIPQTQIK